MSLLIVASKAAAELRYKGRKRTGWERIFIAMSFGRLKQLSYSSPPSAGALPLF